MPSLMQRASWGDLDAQRELVEGNLAALKAGFVLPRTIIGETVCYARLAAAHHNYGDADFVRDETNFIDALAYGLIHAFSTDDEEAHIRYGSELVARVDQHADFGDDIGVGWLAKFTPDADPRIVEGAKVLKQLWAAKAAADDPAPSFGPMKDGL